MNSADVGYCGFNCEACSIHQYGLGHAKDDFILCCRNIPESDLKCDGCKSDSVYAGCRICNLRSCAADRKLSNCGECRDFPCHEYKKLSSAAKILPHAKEASINLEILKREGLDQWRKAQYSKWSCSKCGTPFSWYSKTCMKCGQDLSPKTYSLTGLRKFIATIVLSKVYKKGKQTA